MKFQLKKLGTLDILLFFGISLVIFLLNASIQFFDPLSGGLGFYATAVGSSSSLVWGAALIAIDGLYALYAIITFRRWF